MESRIRAVLGVAALAFAMGLGLSACDKFDAQYPEGRRRGDTTPTFANDKKRETIFGDGGLLGAVNKPGSGQGDGVGIGVNAFLWRASLDTIGFMPIATADAFGGTIITDWHQLPESPGERFKINIFILDRALRADGVKVSVFKQLRDQTGQWVDAKVDQRMATDLENSILTRARQLRVVSTE